MKNPFLLFALICTIYGCTNTNQDKNSSISIYGADIDLGPPWTVSYEKTNKRKHKGWIMFEEDTIIHFRTDTPISVKQDSNTIFRKTILEDKIGELRLGWYERKVGDLIVLRNSEELRPGVPYYCFFANVSRDFKQEEQLIKLYYKIKKQALLRNLIQEENFQQQLFLLRKELAPYN